MNARFHLKRKIALTYLHTKQNISTRPVVPTGGPLCIINDDDDDVVLRHTLPMKMGLGWCLIVSWDFAGAMSIFGPDALPVVHQ